MIAIGQNSGVQLEAHMLEFMLKALGGYTIAQTVDDTASGTRTESSEKKTVTVSGDHAETVGGSSTETVTGPKTITAPAVNLAAAIAIGAPGGASLLPSISSALGAIKDALTTLASHTHPSVGACVEGGTVASKAATVGSAKSSIDSLQG